MTWQYRLFQICDATDENDSEVAMEVLCKGTHIDKDEEHRLTSLRLVG